MSPQSSSSSKGSRKAATTEARSKGVFRTTAFGRRRVMTLAAFLAAAARVIRAPFSYLYRRLRRLDAPVTTA
jgi:hypothetical protein